MEALTLIQDEMGFVLTTMFTDVYYPIFDLQEILGINNPFGKEVTKTIENFLQSAMYTYVNKDNNPITMQAIYLAKNDIVNVYMNGGQTMTIATKSHH